MVTRRSAKTKGNQFEYSIRDSLKPIIHDIVLTKEEGYVSQYDLKSEKNFMAFECKKHRAISWSQAKKYFLKLEEKMPSGFKGFLCFQSNQQPCLVMSRLRNNFINVVEFQDIFYTPFIKH